MKSIAIRAFAFVFVAVTLCTTSIARAQKIDDYPATKLMQESDALRSRVDPTSGSAGRTLEHYPNHLTMLILREKDGQSELHVHTADVFIVVDGSATLWTGGRMTNAKPIGTGEVRGTGLEGAAPTPLAKGDIVHIPADVPHQLKIASGKTFTYFVVKVTDSK